MKNIIYIFILVLTNSCDLAVLWGSGHGSIGGYSFPVAKNLVEFEIEDLIEKNDHIIKLNTDGADYTKIQIISKDTCYYVIRFYGDENYWKTHPEDSEVFIASAKIEGGDYKTEKEIEMIEREKLLNVFEINIIIPLSKQLSVKAPDVAY